MRKKVVSPKEAVEKGMMDDETAEILDKKDNFISPTGERITLSEAVLNKKVNGNKGSIVDPQRGDVLSINEAIERGVLDPDGTNQILIPLAQSLSVPKLAEQGLIEPETCKIIHPETGDHLSLREAIVCDIVDPLSTLTNPDGHTVTLQQAIVNGNVDENKSLVKTRSGSLDLLSALEDNVFDKDPEGKTPIEDIPPAGMTLTVAVQRGLIDADTKNVIHPITGVKTPIEDAIKDNFIMAIPFPVSRDAVQIMDALDGNMIDSDKGTFTNPKTKEVVPISQAIEQGLLVVKPLQELVSFETTGGVTSVTETITSHHTITTKMIEILSGYVLLSANEVKELKTGKVMSMEEARQKGIIKDEKTSKEHFTTKEVKVSFEDAVKQGLVDMEAGTYCNPDTGKSMTITEAITQGILDTSIESTPITEYTEIVEIKTEYLTLIEAYETIYDETTSTFRDPKNPNRSYTFKEALEKKIIDPESVVYDVQSGSQVTLKDALKKGLIDPKSGKVKDKATGKSVDIKNAAKMGILAVVASPVLAGMAIAKGIKNLTKKSPDKEEVPDKAMISGSKSLTKKSPDKEDIYDRTTISRPKSPTKKSPDKEEIPHKTMISESKSPTKKSPEKEDISDKTISGPKSPTKKSPEKEDIYDRTTISRPKSPTKKSPEKEEIPDKTTISGSKSPIKKSPDKEDIYDRTISGPKSPIKKSPDKEDIYDRAITGPMSPIKKSPDKEDIYDRAITGPKSPIKKSPDKEDIYDRVISGPKSPIKKSPDKEVIPDKTISGLKSPTKKSPDNVEFSDRTTISELKSPTKKSPDNVEFSERTMISELKNLLKKSPSKEEITVRTISGLKTPTDKSTIQSKNNEVPEVSPVVPPRKPKTGKEDISPDKNLISSIAGIPKPERPLSDAIESVNIQEEILVSSSITTSREDRLHYVTDTIPKYISDTIEKVAVKSPSEQIDYVDFVNKSESTDRISPIREKPTVIDELSPSEKSYTILSSTQSEVAYERLPLGDAISQRKIEPKVCRILVDGQESVFTIQDALEQGEISPLDLVDIVSKNCISIVSDKPKSISFNELSPEILTQYGFYDPERQIFLDPRTGMKISFIDMIYSVYDPQNLFVQDLNSKTEQFSPLEEAIAIPLIDKNTGHMVDPKSGKRVSFFDCIDRGWIVEGHPSYMTVNEPVTFESALDSGVFDKSTAEYKDPNTGEVYSFAEAIRLKLIDPDSISLKNPNNNEIITLTEAIELGFVDLYHGVIIDIETKHQIELKVAFLNGLLSTSTRRPVSLEAVIKLNLYDPATGKIKDPSTSQKVTIDEAVERAILHPTISEIKDTRADAFVTLEDALTTKLVNSETGKLRDTKEGSLITLDVAYQRGYVLTKQLRWSMIDIIEKGYYHSKTGTVLDPRSGSEIKIKEAIETKLFEIDTIKIRDEQHDKLISVNNAIKVGLFNDDAGIITNPEMSLDVANEKGYLLSDKKPWSLQEGLVQGCYDPDTGLLTIDSATKTLDDAIKKGEIDPDVMTIRNSKTSEIITLRDAIKAGIIDSKLGKVKDPLKGDEITFVDASERGLIIPAKRKFSLPEAVFKGFYDPKSGKFTHPESREKVATDRALKKGMLDPQSTLVNVDGKVLPFEFAVDRGIVDVRTGTVVLGDKQKIDFQEAFERGFLIEVRKPMSLSEAVSKGVYDERTGLFMDPNTGKKYHLAEAIKLNLIDPDSVHVKDIRSGSWKKISLPESLKIGVVDSETGKVKDINKDNSELTIKEAFEIGLLVDSKASISLQRVIHQGLYDDKTGKFADPVSSRRITLHEAIRKFIINPNYLCYFDKKSEKPLTLAEACRTGIVDRRSGMFTEPNSDVSITLSRAMELGLIVDIEGAGFSLYDALAMGFYDVDKSKFKHPVTERPLTLKESVADDLISPETSLIKNIQASKYVKLPEAIKCNLIDENIGCYNLPNGNSINLIEAKLRGLIVTNGKNLSIEEAVKNGLFRPDTGKFVDPTSGDFLDLNAAIMNGFIDPDTTALKDPITNKLKSLVAAIENGDIDVTKGRVLDSKMKRAYNLDVALDKGHLVTVLKPLTSSRGIRRSSVDYTRDKEPILREFTLDEALRFEFIDPHTAVVKDPQTGKFRPLQVAIEEGTIDLNVKAAFDPQSGRSRSVCVIFENGLIVYYHEPLTFEQAIEMKLLDTQTARFTHPRTNEVLSVKDAAILGHVDSDTALIKDNLKKKLVKLPEAFRKGLMDAEKGNILDTETSKLHPLTTALENGLLITPKRSFTLSECLEFGIYNPTTGGFSDPFITTSIIDRKRLTLTDCIDQGIVDPSSTVVKDPDNGHIIPLQQAITAKLVDPIGGRLVVDPSKETTIDLVKAQAKGYILAAETRQAVEEKYRLCDEQLNKLLDWVSDIEEKLANQEPVKEEKDDLRNQINNIKQIKEEIDSQQRAVSGVGEQARQLVVTGGAVLAAREADALERAAKQLRERADRANGKANNMLRRLQAAWDELAKFSNELSTFNTWLDASYRLLEEQERALAQLGKPGDRGTGAARDFLGDVMAHQADLRFITMAAQKFVDESKEFLSTLNDFRTSLPSRYSHLTQPAESQVRGQVQLAGRRHSDLLARAQRLQDRLRGVGDTRRLYGEAVEKAGRWLKEMEPQCRAVISEAIAGDPKAVEAQLSRAKALHNEMLAQSRLIENAKDACDQLLQTLEGHLTPAEIRSLEVPVIELENRYAELSGALGEQCGVLEGALVQSQGLQDALEGQAAWISQAENLFKSQYKAASLIRERLDEQQREHKISAADLAAHRPSLEQLAAAAKNLLSTASNARLATKIDQRMKDVYNRYEKLLEKSVKRSEFLEEVSTELHVFSNQATQAEQWCTKLVEKANSSELGRMTPEDCQIKMEQLAEERDSRKQMVDECLRNGKQLIAKKDVTDTQVIRDKMKGLEVQWKDLITSMDEKQKLSKQRADQLNQYEKLRAQVVTWLTHIEDRVNRLQPVAVEMEVIRSQQDELRPLNKEYRDYGHQIDKVNEAGSVYDSLLRGDRPDSPHRKRSSQTAYSPTKRPSQASLRGTDRRSPSPTKTGLGLVSPISASGSSGFSSRRSSQDGFHLEEFSPVQQQLSEINNRYTLLGVKLSDRHSELDTVKEEVRKHLESLKNLSLFLDKVQRQLPKDTVPNTKEEADKTNKQVRAVLEDMYEKQSLLDSTKSQVKELLRRKAGVIGADRLQDEMEDVASRWKKLHDSCKDKIKMMEEMKDFLDTHDSLVSWLGAKDRMMAALGPISSDSRMVQTQVQQVQVLREELRTQQPQLSHLEEVGASVLERLEPKSPDHTRVAGKLSQLQARWADLLNRLDERAESLGAAVDTSREFDAGLSRLRDALQSISDNLDDLPLEKDSEEQLRKIENLERQLEGQRPLLAELEARGAALCEVLTDPACRQDIQGKLAQVGRQYNNLQRKLDHRKAEQEGALRDGRQLEESVSRTLGWIQGELGELAGRLLVSADKEKLRQQLERHGPAYREAMAKEHEVIMLLNKGREMENRPAHPNLRKELDRIQQQWEKLRREVVDRQTRLQTAMEHCKKYGKAQEVFLPWLAQAEDKLDKLAPAAFQKKQIEKQLRELQQIRNDVWKKSGEYENNRSLGETFVAACDVDQDIVKDQLGGMKNRWDKLNNDLMEKLDWLENTSHRLADFTDQSRDIEHALRRCEDRLGAAEIAPADRRLLDTVSQIAEEAALLETPVKTLLTTAETLSAAAREAGADAQSLLDEADSFRERLMDLNSRLGDVKGKLHNATTAVAQFNEQVKGLSLDLSELERDLDTMKPAGRDIKVVRQQLDDLGRFYKKLEDVAGNVAEVQKVAEALVDSGVASDAAQTRDQVDTLRKQLAKLDERARSKEQELDDALVKLEAFYADYDNVMGDLQEVGEMVRKMKPVGSEVDQIRAQQKELGSVRRDTLEPLGEAVARANRAGRALVQGAAQQVPTQRLEGDLEKMNEAWNQIMEKTNDRERRLDSALLQSGRLKEALSGLERWLADTEAMVAAQRPPSADYKVVKAQLQEQKFLNKMLLDRQGSMSSLFAMGGEVAAGCEPAERRAIEQQLKGLVGRFEALTDGAQKRMLDLEQAMRVAKQFQEQLQPLLEWLGVTERKVKGLELVPTDEEKIQQRIREHKGLHDDILSKRPDFSELTETASTLMGLVGEDEATALADRLQAATDRYQALADNSMSAGELLDRSRAALRHLVLTYQELGAWMDAAERRLRRARPLPVHTEALLRQMDDLAELTEEIASKQEAVESTVESGLELMKHISGDEALQLKDKLDALQRRYGDLTTRGADLLRAASEALPLLQHFHNSHNKLVDWMGVAEAALQTAEPREQDIIRLEEDLQHFRPVLEAINLVGPQLCQISPGEGAATIEGLVTRDNRRFDAIVEQIQRKAERLHLSKLRSREVASDMDDLLEWFREADERLRGAAPPGCEPPPLRAQLKEHRAFNDDVSGQRARVRDLISNAKKVLRESQPSEDASIIRDKMEELRETMETVGQLSSDRLGILEQALPLAEHFADTHEDLSTWLDDMERQIGMLAMPALRPEQIASQQDKNEMLMQSINEHKPLVDKLVKTGEALSQLCSEDDAQRLHETAEGDCTRYGALRAELRARQQALEGALQESALFADKLEGMLRALAGAHDQVGSLEPVSAHPPKIEDQIEENNAIAEDLDKREEAYAAVKRAANDVINKASNKSDPAVKDIKKKLERLNALWNDVQKATGDRGRSLEETLELARKFWRELTAVMATLRELEEALAAQEAPAAQPRAIQAQQVALQEIRQEIDQTKPEVEQVRKTGSKLMNLCGEPDKPEVKKHIEDLDSAWDNITALYAKREENLIDAMEKAMEFHETLQNLLEFLETAEEKFERMGPLGSDIDAVKKQIVQLNKFKDEVDPHMVKVEALNRQAQELTERTSSEQAASIREPLAGVNRRWAALVSGMADRQRRLEGALLRLGQFQHALQELMVWIDRSDATLDSLKPVAGDPQVLEVELAKLKVLANDIQAHQNSVDTLNDAGVQIIQQGKGTDEASTTQDKLQQLNRKWRDLQQKAKDRQLELEEALREAQRFHAEIQDLLSWLGDVDSIIAASKPVGGLPETASEQLERFMEVFNEVEENRPKVEAVLQQGQEYLKKQDRPQSVSNLQHNLKTLKQRWDSVTARASDKKIKLEIALKEATEFHDALQAFVDWLTNAEKVLTSAKPVSRVMESILSQIEEHKSFQKEVSTHRETMLHLDKKGTHLKYFSQKQDVILIKNLLVSVQHRWERVVAKAAERTRALDHGFKEAREFHDQWSSLMNWLTDTEKSLDELNAEQTVNDPDKIKHRLDRHREFQKALGSKQPVYDTAMKCGKQLKEKAPKTDEPMLRQMLGELKTMWTTVCSKAVDRQRKLEEALLFSGQFKDAMSALLEWLKRQEAALREDTPVHGDLDTVMGLVEKHKQLEESLNSRSAQMESVIRTGRELEATAPPQDAAQVSSQLTALSSLWQNVNKLCDRKTSRLEEALKEAEKLHKSVHMLLEWLSDAETKLRFAAQPPEDEHEAANQLRDHERFLQELREKAKDKDFTLALAHAILAKAHPDGASVIKHWITIITSRWEEVSQWALQRQTKLNTHLQSLKDLDLTLEELLQWLMGLENTLLALESEPLPDNIELLEGLITDHKDLMETTQKRQTEVDRVCKANQIKSAPGKDSPRKISAKGPIKGQQGKGSEPEFRSGRVKLLWEKWRGTWLLAWERQRRLHDHLMHLKELEQVRNFSWDDWRKRFLKFMNHKKSRLTDLFRKMDKDNNGLIPREDFIDGIMNTKFDTFRLEMNAVADLFDRNNSGLIDWQEFIAALRPDWVDRRPETDADKIHDEVKRLVMLCTCRQKFRVFQVGEGKYRFGDSQKLRLVRILRSTVMVRVGGGWVALDEFLVKNDPCRAKGRTNIELREQFILADGVSQSMTAFKAKTPRSSTNTPPTLGTAGPITKVRERSARSVPMGTTRASRSSLSAGTPDSLSDNEASLGQTPRSALKKPSITRSNLTPGGSGPPSRPSSRPASRTGSKPPSRHGSNLSLDSTDDGTPSRIPLSRRLPTTTTTTRSGLSTPRTTAASKLSAPNGSARPRTPTGLMSPAPGRYTGSGMFRTSSIPTLSATGSLASKSASSQPASLGHERLQKHSSSHSHPIQPAPGSKIPLFVGPNLQNERREKSRSESPQRKREALHQDQRSPEEDSSLFNISNISNASSSNSSYSISGGVQPPLSDVTGSCNTATERSPSTEKQPRSGSFHRPGEAPPSIWRTPGSSKIPVFSKEITNTTNISNMRARTPSGSSTPVLPGQATAASRLLRKGSNASESSTAAGNATAANGRKTPVRSSATPDRNIHREPFRL